MTSKKPAKKREIAPIAWLFIAIFSGVLVVVPLYTFTGCG